MAKKFKKIEKGIESLKKEIKKHFEKIEEDIKEKNINRGRYHIKEIDKSLLKSLEIKMKTLGLKDKEFLKKYRERLDNLKKILDLEE